MKDNAKSSGLMYDGANSPDSIDDNVDLHDSSKSAATPLGIVGRTILGVYLVVLPILLGYMVFTLWPTAKPDATGNIPDSMVNLFGYHFLAAPEVRLILLVMVVGALGSYIHSATSFVDFTGNRRLYKSWVWWYILRTFVGVSLSLVFYFVIRGGLLSAGATAQDLSPFGIAAVSGLVGMFAKQATDKLGELSDNLFKTEKPAERGDKLTHPKPSITDLDPKTVLLGITHITLKVSGSGFVPESEVKFNGKDQTCEYISSTQLTVRIRDEDIASAGEIKVTVFNPSPGGGTSNERTLTITP